MHQGQLGTPPLNGMHVMQVPKGHSVQAQDLLNCLKGVDTLQFYTTGEKG